jgi:hypothetical protein
MEDVVSLEKSFQKYLRVSRLTERKAGSGNNNDGGAMP